MSKYLGILSEDFLPTGFLPVHFADKLGELGYKLLQRRVSFNTFGVQFLTCYEKSLRHTHNQYNHPAGGGAASFFYPCQCICLS